MCLWSDLTIWSNEEVLELSGSQITNIRKENNLVKCFKIWYGSAPLHQIILCL